MKFKKEKITCRGVEYTAPSSYISICGRWKVEQRWETREWNLYFADSNAIDGWEWGETLDTKKECVRLAEEIEAYEENELRKKELKVAKSKASTFPKAFASVNKYIQKKHPGLQLFKGEGYFYFASDLDNDLDLELAGVYSTSVLVYALHHLSYGQWMEEADNVMKQVEENRKEEQITVAGWQTVACRNSSGFNIMD